MMKKILILQLLIILAFSTVSYSQDILNDPRLFERGQTRVYSGEHLEAISFPVGGLGSGLIQINGKAERHVWQIFNNFTQAIVPNSFFAIRAKAEGQNAVVRALQTTAVGPFSAMDNLTFSGEYPFGWYNFHIDSRLVSLCSTGRLCKFGAGNKWISGKPWIIIIRSN